jgi:hypothetical protein
VSARADLKSRIARALAAHAVRVAEPDDAEWTKAMMHEREHLPPDASVLSWALGCVSVSYRGRLRAITFPDLLRWVALLMLLLLCLGPACWNFIHITVSVAQGYPLFPGARAFPATSMQAGLIFGSATLVGPIGLAASLWTLSSPAHRPGTMFMVVLWTLTAWGFHMLRLPAQYPLLTHTSPGNEIFTILLNFVLLPALGVTLLQCLDVRRRRTSSPGPRLAS